MMKIECSECHTQYQLVVSRIEKKQRFRVKCKKCKNLIVIDFTKKHPDLNPTWVKLFPKNVLYGEALHKDVVSNFKRLYPMPHVALKARQLILDPESDFRRISNLLKTDQALASRILKVANSAYFGLCGKVSSIQHASALLGTKLLVQIINMVSHSKMLGGTMLGYDVDSGIMWRHSIAVAVGSDFIAKKMAPEYSGEAFLTGLLHDAGKIILDKFVLERQASFRELLKDSKQSTVDVERKILGFDHAKISGDLCIHWNLPDFVAEAVEFHHFPSYSRANMLAYIVHAADAIAKHVDQVTSEVDFDTLDSNTLNFLNLEDKKLQAMAHQILEAVETLEDDTY